MTQYNVRLLQKIEGNIKIESEGQIEAEQEALAADDSDINWEDFNHKRTIISALPISNDYNEPYDREEQHHFEDIKRLAGLNEGPSTETYTDIMGIREVLGDDTLIDELLNWMDSHDAANFVKHIKRHYEI